MPGVTGFRTVAHVSIVPAGATVQQNQRYHHTSRALLYHSPASMQSRTTYRVRFSGWKVSGFRKMMQTSCLGRPRTSTGHVLEFHVHVTLKAVADPLKNASKNPCKRPSLNRCNALVGYLWGGGDSVFWILSVIWVFFIRSCGMFRKWVTHYRP